MENSNPKWIDVFRKVSFLLLVIFSQSWKLVRRATKPSPIPAWHCCRESREKTLIIIRQTSQKCVLMVLVSQLLATKLTSQKFNFSQFNVFAKKRSHVLLCWFFGLFTCITPDLVGEKCCFRVQVLPCFWVVFCCYPFGLLPLSEWTTNCLSAEPWFYFVKQNLSWVSGK